MKQAAAKNCAISSDTFKRIYLLTVIGSYKNGVYGLKRLQKITYLSELESSVKPYTFKRHHYGQYSEELASVNNALIDSKFVKASLLIGSQCCVYALADGIDVSYYKDILSKINPELTERIIETVDEFGYLPEDKLVELCYSLPQFKKKESGEIVIEAQIPDEIEISGISDQECEELELTFSEPFISSMLMLTSELESSIIDMDSVEKVDIKI